MSDVKLEQANKVALEIGRRLALDWRDDQVKRAASIIAAALSPDAEAMRKALEPFAKAAADYADRPDDVCVLKHKPLERAQSHVMAGDLRRAAEAYAAPQTPAAPAKEE